MVIKLLCATVMMQYIYYEQMDPYYLSGKVFGFTNKEVTRIRHYLGFPGFRTNVASRCPTFKINGHEAFV